MPIVILLQGAQSVGKTTLALRLQERLSISYNICCLSDIGRTLIKGGVTHDISTTMEDYFAYYYMHTKNFNKILSSNFDVVIMDRSYIDVVTYSRLMHGKDNWIEKLGIELIELFNKYVNYIVYLPIEFPIVPDGIRNENEHSQAKFDKTIVEIMKCIKLPYHTITGSVDTRLNKVLALINRAI